MRVDAPTYDCEVEHDVPYLDVAAVHAGTGGIVTVFIVNRHLGETAELDMVVGEFDSYRLLTRETMCGGDRRQTKSAETPDRVAPRAGEKASVENGRLVSALPPLSYHVIRLECV